MPQHITTEKVFNLDLQHIFTNVKLLKLLEVASRHIGEINNIVSNVLEFDFIITALKNIEALNSARIEGTTGNLKDLYLENALDFERKKQLKLFSAINYKMTMGQLEEIIRTYGRVDFPLIRHLHKLLTDNDPSTKGISGKFRTGEVAIRNTALGNFYPAHPTKIEEFMERFVKELSEKDDYPNMIQAAVMHYQFETIHPFEDGNGRTGRLLIVAYLLINKTLECAVLNLSQYFDTHREEYVESLRSVSDTSDYEKWITFFLTAIIEQCRHNINLIKSLRELKERNELLINEKARSPVVQQVLNHSLNSLYITVPDTAIYLKKKNIKGDLKQSARNNIKKLLLLGILKKTDFKIGKTESYVHEELKKMIMRS